MLGYDSSAFTTSACPLAEATQRAVGLSFNKKEMLRVQLRSKFSAPKCCTELTWQVAFTSTLPVASNFLTMPINPFSAASVSAECKSCAIFYCRITFLQISSIIYETYVISSIHVQFRHRQ